MSTNRKTTPKEKQPLTLQEIREAIVKADAQRLEPGLDQESRLALEDACLTLRMAESKAIADVETGLVKGFDDCVDGVRLQAKEIRSLTARMNKVPKVLGTTQTVIKECVKVLKAVAQWATMIAMMLYVCSCATMTKAQLSRVNSLAGMVDSVSAGPARVFDILAGVRDVRGTYYSASFSNPAVALAGLNDMALQDISDEKISKKADVPNSVLKSYISALKTLSADTRWKSPGSKIEGIGRSVDSLFMAYNRMGWVDDSDAITVGTARQVGKSTGWLTQQYVKRRQRYLVKQMLVQGDTVVAGCCDSLVAVLKSPEMTDLIDFEEKRLEDDFRAYLTARPDAGTAPYRDYLDQKRQLQQAAAMRKNSISWLQSLKRAHHTLLEEMDKHATYDEVSAALFELNSQLLLWK